MVKSITFRSCMLQGTQTIFFTLLVLRKVNRERVLRNAIFSRKGMPFNTFDVRPD